MKRVKTYSHARIRVHGVWLASVLGHEVVDIVDDVRADGGSHHSREGGLGGAIVGVVQVED
jgi:hypothetical protein